MKEEEEKVRRVNPFNGWDVCRRNSFLGVKSWLMVEGEGRGGGHEDLAAGYHSNFIIVSNYAKQLDSLPGPGRGDNRLFPLPLLLLLPPKVPVVQEPGALD